MDWIDYVNEIDDSHQMTTDKKHIKILCEMVSDKNYSIVEFGSHAGISTAALALSSPKSTIKSVDLCDSIPENFRTRYWSSLGITNIMPIPCSTIDFLNRNKSYYDFIFHDAVHGMRAMKEYLMCCNICHTLAIHDFEKLPPSSQEIIISKFNNHILDHDKLGRFLFVGFNK